MQNSEEILDHIMHLFETIIVKNLILLIIITPFGSDDFK